MRDAGLTSFWTGDVYMWTLWLISVALGAVQGGGASTTTPLSIYQTQNECYESINQIRELMKKQYPNQPPSIGLMFCVSGKPIGK
jgi:hypothetical protein